MMVLDRDEREKRNRIVIELYQQNRSYEYIANKTGISLNYVPVILKMYGIKRKNSQSRELPEKTITTKWQSDVYQTTRTLAKEYKCTHTHIHKILKRNLSEAEIKKIKAAKNAVRGEREGVFRPISITIDESTIQACISKFGSLTEALRFAAKS